MQAKKFGAVELIYFDPCRPVFSYPWRRIFPWKKRLRNFGDLLGPHIVNLMLSRASKNFRRATKPSRLLTIGSILHFAADDDFIWGSGRNGKVPDKAHAFSRLHVRSVRGPLTREFLMAQGIEVPQVYGDPGLLLGLLRPDLMALANRTKRREFTYIPNYNDLKWTEGSKFLLDPRSPIETCLKTIATSEFIAASSLHGIIVAESLKVPARLIRSRAENPFKYQDYYCGTGRPNFRVAETLLEAISLGGEEPPILDTTSLLDSFPYDLWN